MHLKRPRVNASNSTSPSRARRNRWARALSPTRGGALSGVVRCMGPAKWYEEWARVSTIGPKECKGGPGAAAAPGWTAKPLRQGWLGGASALVGGRFRCIMRLL